MQSRYHVQIIEAVTTRSFSQRAVQAVIKANLGQDSLQGLIGHPEYHFDDSAFEKGWDYVNKQRKMLFESLREPKNPNLAWAAFGRLSHALQDFYAHSNYVSLWLHKVGGSKESGSIDPLDKTILTHPGLRSGKAYIPWDVFTFIPFIGKYFALLMPDDSHARMNLDSPERGPMFHFAYAAALQSTELELKEITSGLDAEFQKMFFDRS
ncbi:MAG: hypothetical protein EHM41_01045 [Chloroflexi bacterium]|nr:MAG: hypothetical protein EHM41_01045 [Chloroflexota bacterium]